MTVDEAVAQLAEEAVKLYRARDALINRPEHAPELAHVTGCMAGLRVALCVLKGWDVEQESDKEGRADEFVIGWWRERYPGEWEESTGG